MKIEGQNDLNIIDKYNLEFSSTLYFKKGKLQ